MTRDKQGQFKPGSKEAVENGKRGGQAKVSKGIAKNMTPKERSKYFSQLAKKRKRNKNENRSS